jgi:uncharacterized membrane protein
MEYLKVLYFMNLSNILSLLNYFPTEKNQQAQIFGQGFVYITLLEYPGKQQQRDEFWKLYFVILIITIYGHLLKDLRCVSCWICRL